MTKRNYTVYRNLENKITYVLEAKTENSIRNYELDNFNYGVTIERPTNGTLMPVKEYLEKDTKFSKFLSSNNKNLLHQEMIQNYKGEPIDRALAHLIGNVEVNGISHKIVVTDVWGTVEIEHQTYAIYIKEPDPKNYYVPYITAGHVSAEDKTFKESAIREIAEETGITVDESRVNQSAIISFPERMYESNIYEEDIIVFELRLTEGDLKKFAENIEEVEYHVLLAPERIKDLIDNKPININFKIYKGEINKSNEQITLQDLHPQFEKNKFYLEKQYESLT